MCEHVRGIMYVGLVEKARHAYAPEQKVVVLAREAGGGLPSSRRDCVEVQL